MEDFQKIQILINQASELGDMDLLVPSSKNNELINIFLVIQSSLIMNKAQNLLSNYLKIKIEFNTSFKLLKLNFLGECIKKKLL